MKKINYLDVSDPKERRRRIREISLITLIPLIILFITVFWINLSKESTGLNLTQHILFLTMIHFNIILLVLLFYLVFRNLTKLFFERKSQVLGSKLRTKLVLAFIGLSIIPTVCLFMAAVIFINQSNEKWFSVQIGKSLFQALDVANTSYEQVQRNTIYYAQQISQKITENKLFQENNRDSLKGFLNVKQQEYNLGLVEILTPEDGQLITTLNPKVPASVFSSSSAPYIQKAFHGEELAVKEALDEGEIVKGVVPIYSPGEEKNVVGAVVVNYILPSNLSARMGELASAFDEYQELMLLKNPIKRGYFFFLIMITLLVLFSATWFGIYLAKGITIPVQELAAGTQKIADGDLDVYIDLPPIQDELGMLVESFNKMAVDLRVNKDKLEEANIDLQRTNEESEQRRQYMETVLENINAGVITLDQNGRISTINKAAQEMLEIEAKTVIGRHYREVLRPYHMKIVRDLLRDLDDSPTAFVHREVKFTFENS